MDTTSFPTLLDQVKIDAGIGFDIVDETVSRLRPELKLLPADTMQGSAMTLSVLTALPTVAFRNLNEGTPGSKAKWETRIFQTGIIDQPVQCDRRSADTAKDYGRFLKAQTIPFLEAAMRAIASQFYYGITNDAKGFIGLIAQSNPSTATHVKDAGGSTGKTSAWLLDYGPGKLEWLWGNNQTLLMEDVWKEETLYDANGDAFPGLSNWIKGLPGIRLANKNVAIRIKNLGTDSGKGLSDAVLFDALKLATDLGISPNAILLNGRSHEQWRAGRTATTTTGAPAPLPRDFEGIPVYPTPAIINGETI